MTESIFATDSEDFPPLPATDSFVHRLAGLPPEYLVEPRVLLEKDGYVKGAKIEQTKPLSPANLATVKQVLTDRSNYGDRGMGARCLSWFRLHIWGGFSASRGAHLSRMLLGSVPFIQCGAVVGTK